MEKKTEKIVLVLIIIFQVCLCFIIYYYQSLHINSDLLIGINELKDLVDKLSVENNSLIDSVKKMSAENNELKEISRSQEEFIKSQEEFLDKKKPFNNSLTVIMFILYGLDLVFVLIKKNR